MPDELPIDCTTWTHADTRAWLSAYPLPPDFTWPDRDHCPPHRTSIRAVLPKYKLSGGYGKWLQETPTFPGLFELCHDILAQAPSDAVLTPEWLAAELKSRRADTQAKTLP